MLRVGDVCSEFALTLLTVAPPELDLLPVQQLVHRFHGYDKQTVYPGKILVVYVHS